MEEKLAEMNESEFLEIRIFMTRGWSRDDAARIILHDDEQGREGKKFKLAHCLKDNYQLCELIICIKSRPYLPLSML